MFPVPHLSSSVMRVRPSICNGRSRSNHRRREGSSAPREIHVEHSNWWDSTGNLGTGHKLCRRPVRVQMEYTGPPSNFATDATLKTMSFAPSSQRHQERRNQRFVDSPHVPLRRSRKTDPEERHDRAHFETARGMRPRKTSNSRRQLLHNGLYSSFLEHEQKAPRSGQ